MAGELTPEELGDELMKATKRFERIAFGNKPPIGRGKTEGVLKHLAEEGYLEPGTEIHYRLGQLTERIEAFIRAGEEAHERRRPTA